MLGIIEQDDNVRSL